MFVVNFGFLFIFLSLFDVNETSTENLFAFECFIRRRCRRSRSRCCCCCWRASPIRIKTKRVRRSAAIIFVCTIQRKYIYIASSEEINSFKSKCVFLCWQHLCGFHVSFAIGDFLGAFARPQDICRIHFLCRKTVRNQRRKRFCLRVRVCVYVSFGSTWFESATRSLRLNRTPKRLQIHSLVEMRMR